ncbi:hypothetical protein CXZ10_04605 [Pleomorphomonas diazotrophica]|uniref:Alpha/beta hydrolase fold-3 domain-containing protein n=1 Tax=Pleomorphomonas diazotrophica TaxID=1166257 RepID=A0A1I4QIZ3_9HYPH|nr:alpha/beta hydrolase [Pleomorphomonas diazotrophica]PKR90645.1 hypothetical protein CXZ10_04605 [Pleomorphomonas diazotrophica]SFM39665.1 acetyl esterase [Pleomorphomonas diazotrophica]
MSELSSVGLSVESGVVPGWNVPIRTYRNPEANPKAQLVFAHGGGFSWGTLDDYDQICRNLAAGTVSTVISVDYRLAPENPFPAGFDDVYHAAVWAASQLNKFNEEKLIIAGDSAGACLAAGVAQRAAAEQSMSLDGQLLIYPMIEYYDRTPPEFFTLSDRFHPSFDAIRGAWDTYLGGPRTELPPYAVPPRATDLSALPPAFLAVAENDPLRFEALSYAAAMHAAGVRVEHRQYGGVGHGFLSERPDASSVRSAILDIATWIGRL